MKRFVKLGTRISASFTVFIILLSVIGTLFGEDAKSISMMFSLGGAGVSFQVIIQGLFLISLISLLGLVFEELRMFKRMLQLYKFIIMLVSSALITIVFIVIFRWFPIDHPAAWLGFFISFTLCVILSTLFMIYKTKKEDEEVQKLFHSYKQHQKGERNYENN